MQVLLAATLPLVGVLIGATLQYAFGQRLEARKLLVAQKALAYSDFIRLCAASVHSRDTDTLARIADAKTRICIYASMDVVQKLRNFDTAGANAIDDDGQANLLALLSAMREDVTGKGFSGCEDTFMPILFGASGADIAARKS
jgi:hypothetical protein